MAAGSFDRFSKETAARYKANLIRGIVDDIPKFAERAPKLSPDRSGKRGPLWDRLKVADGTTYEGLAAKPPTAKDLEPLNIRELSELRQSLSEPIRQAAQKTKDELAAINLAAAKLRDEIAAALPKGARAGEHYAGRADELRQRLDEALAKENQSRKLTGQPVLTDVSLKDTRAAIEELKRISGQMLGHVKDTATLEATRADLAQKRGAAEELLKNYGCTCGGENGATANVRCVVAVPGDRTLAWSSQAQSDCTAYCAAIRRDRDCSRLAAQWGLKPLEAAQTKFETAQKEMVEFEKGLGATVELIAKLDEQRKIVSRKSEIAGLTAPLAPQAFTADAPIATPALETREPATVPQSSSLQVTAVSRDLNSVTVDVSIPGADVVNFDGRTFALTNGRGRFTFPVGCCGSSFPQMWVGSQGQWHFSTILSIHGGQNVRMHLPRRRH